MDELELMRDLGDAMDAKLTTYKVLEQAQEDLKKDTERINEAKKALEDYRKEHNIV